MFSENPEIKKNKKVLISVLIGVLILIAIILFIYFYSFKIIKKDEEKQIPKVKLTTSLQGVLPQNILDKEGKKENISIEVIENNNNYSTPGEQLMLNNTDAILSGHAPWLFSKHQNNEWQDIVPIQPFYIADYAIWQHENDGLSFPEKGKCSKLLKDLKVLIYDDPSNVSLALMLLEKKGFLCLEPNSYNKNFIDLSDIKFDDSKLKRKNIKCVNMSQIGQMFNQKLSSDQYEYDLAVSFPKLMPSKDSQIKKIKFDNSADNDDSFLLDDDKFNVFAICVMARKDNKDSENISRLKKVLQTDELIKHNNEEFKGHLKMIPADKMSQIMKNIKNKYQLE